MDGPSGHQHGRHGSGVSFNCKFQMSQPQPNLLDKIGLTSSRMVAACGHMIVTCGWQLGQSWKLLQAVMFVKAMLFGLDPLMGFFNRHTGRSFEQWFVRFATRITGKRRFAFGVIVNRLSQSFRSWSIIIVYSNRTAPTSISGLN